MGGFVGSALKRCTITLPSVALMISNCQTVLLRSGIMPPASFNSLLPSGLSHRRVFQVSLVA
jgi:hypothetical protein